jgi:hypothetical protein
MLCSELPEGSMDAKQFIHNNYEQAIRKIKKNSHTILVVARDADTETYTEVIGKFDNADNIFIVIPKRNIETWFFFIDNVNTTTSNDEQIDRKNNYPKNGTKPTEYGEKFETLVNDMRNGKSFSNMPDSMQRTIKHLLTCEKARRITL